MSACKYKRGGYCGLRNDIRAKLLKIKSYCIEGPCPDEKPLTNADRIRVMTDEELADFMAEIMYCVKCWKFDKEQGICTRTSGCNSAMLDWLKQEADDES